MASARRQHILFICLGNICRSPLAEGLFRRHVAAAGLDHLYVIDSAGTGDWHVGELPDPRTRASALAHGLELTHRARQLQRSDLDAFDWLLCMDSSNLRNTLALAAGDHQRRKVLRLRDLDPDGPGDVPDPYHGGPEDFELVYHMLDRTTRALFSRLQQGGLPNLA